MRPTNPKYSDADYWFKSKGKEHSLSKVKVLVPIDVEKVNSANEFVKNTFSKNRCTQGIEFMNEQNLELSRKSTGSFIRWVVNDIISEELDVLVESKLEPKDVTKSISDAARRWYFEYLGEADVL